jgi:integrase
MKAKSKQPLETVTIKGASVAIYFTPTHKAGKEYPGHTLAYTEAGKRKRQFVTSLDKAKETAKSIARQLSEGTGHVHSLTPGEVADYTAAIRLLRTLPGVQLSEAVSIFTQAAAILKDPARITDAAKLYRQQAEAKKIPSILAVDLVQEFLAAKSKDGVSDRYYNDCKVRLAHFTKAFHCPVHSIQTTDLQQWLDKVKGGSRTTHNYCSGIKTLFEFAKKRGYLPRNIETEASHLTVGKVKEAAPGIYSPDTLQSVLDAAVGLDRLAVAMAAFTGMRSAELHRLEWTDVKADHIVVSAEKAKTASRRIVPILPALRTVLNDYERTEGRIFHTNNNESHFPRFYLRAFNTAGGSTEQNGFRHSYASYRLAAVKSADQVALEMGNSPRKLFANYREIVTEQDAVDWFDVTPGSTPPAKKREEREKAKAEKVILMPRKVA